MLEATSALLRTQGFHATGLNQILKESGAPKGSLYYHFPGGKEQLAAEAMQAAAEDLGTRMVAAFDKAGDFRQGLKFFLADFIGELEQSDFQCGCPIATVALEANCEPVLEVCRHAFRWALQTLSERLQMEGHAKEESDRVATVLFSAFEGALLLSRTERDTKFLRQLEGLVDRLLPQS